MEVREVGGSVCEGIKEEKKKSKGVGTKRLEKDQVVS